MIRKIQVKNYKSLKDVDLELGLRNVLVGPNMSGKSNIYDCFKFLTSIVSGGLARALLDRGGFFETAWKGVDSGTLPTIFIKLVIEIGNESNIAPSELYDYDISIIGTDAGLFSIREENLLLTLDGKKVKLIELRNGSGQMYDANGKVLVSPADATKSGLEYDIPGWKGMNVKNYISQWRFYHLVTANMRQPGATSAQRFLQESGNNFSSWMMTLSTSYPPEFNLIRQVARDAFPGLEEILTPPTQYGTTIVISSEKNLRRPVPIWQMSDGEIIFLAFLSLIFAPPALGTPLICVEEVENHLHPRLLETLVEVANQRQKQLGLHSAQTIVTTHSPYLVDKMNLEDLIVVEKTDAATKCSRPSTKSHLKELLQRKEFGLGELWYSGALGADK